MANNEHRETHPSCFRKQLEAHRKAPGADETHKYECAIILEKTSPRRIKSAHINTSESFYRLFTSNLTAVSRTWPSVNG